MCHMRQMQGMTDLLLDVGIPESLSTSPSLQLCNTVAYH